MSDAHALAEKLLAHRARTHPAWATLAGLPGHDHELRATSRASFEDEARDLDALLREAERLPPSLDHDSLVTQLTLEVFELREVRSWARNPDLASDYFDHLFSLLIAAHLAPDARAAALLARLEGAPRYFADAWPRFDPRDVPKLWVEGAKRSVEGASAFFDAVREAAAGPDIERAIDAARAAVEAHAKWLDGLHVAATGPVALGRERFERLLRLRRIPDAPDALVKQGEALVARFRREMEEAAVTVLAAAGKEPDDDAVGEALAVAKMDHPRTFKDVLDAYATSIRDAKAAVVAAGLARVPDVPLDVVETPTFLRHLVPFAAYMSPARFATPRRGVYLVTPKADLSAFPNADTRNVTVHEAYPGHHLQLSVAAEEGSLASYLCDAPDLVEGWALYCEWLMGVHGYTAAPAERLMRAKDARWRALRIVLDVGLNVGDVLPEEAASRLADETRMSREEAEAEVLRYTLSPGYNLSYTWGMLKIQAMREKALARGHGERAFHDAVLRQGSVPISLVEIGVFSELL